MYNKGLFFGLGVVFFGLGVVFFGLGVVFFGLGVNHSISKKHLNYTCVLTDKLLL